MTIFHFKSMESDRHLGRSYQTSKPFCAAIARTCSCLVHGSKAAVPVYGYVRQLALESATPHKMTGTRKGSHMNQDQVKGKWDQIKGRAKEAWGVLTDDDFKKAEGSVEKLYGIIQEKVGDTKEAIRTKLDKLDAESKKSSCCG